MPYIMLIIGLVVLDQLSKYLVRTGLSLYESIPLIDRIFHITYIQNRGAAFSILQGKQFFLILVTALALAGILLFIVLKHKQSSPLLLIGLSLLLSGGVGNLIDRIALGYVVDFFDFRIWPVFNVADISVCCGCGMIIIYVFLSERLGAKDKN